VIGDDVLANGADIAAVETGFLDVQATFHFSESSAECAGTERGADPASDMDHTGMVGNSDQTPLVDSRRHFR
jgi:hypothetical protein